MSTLKADTIQAATTNGNLAISNQGTGGIAIDGMPHRNLIINGDMRIAARGTSFAAAAVNTYTLDRWEWMKVGTGVVTVTQDTDAPTPAEAGTDYKFSFKVDVTTADASIAASDRYWIHQKIEGFNTAHLGFGASSAATITLSFWVKAAKTGAHYVNFTNSATDRTYPASYSISVADTWEKKTIKVVGDTSGTWIGATNGVGLWVQFLLAAGTDHHATANTWSGTADQAGSDIVNELDNTANNFYLTGVQLEVGAAATDFEHRDYASELARCSRYFERIGGDRASQYISIGHTSATATCNIALPHRKKRSNPTVTVSGATHFNVAQSGGANATTGMGTLVGQTDVSQLVATVSGTPFDADGAANFQGDGTTNHYIDIDAEL